MNTLSTMSQWWAIVPLVLLGLVGMWIDWANDRRSRNRYASIKDRTASRKSWIHALFGRVIR